MILKKGETKMAKIPVLMANDRQAAKDAYAFLQKQLEKVDSKILEPLSSTLWPRDMPVKTGGGFVESVSTVNVTYATTGNGDAGLIFNEANDIPTMQAEYGKDITPVFNWANSMVISYIDKKKFEGVALNLEEALNKGIHKAYDRFCDDNVFLGFAKVGTTGLINNPNITRVAAAPHTENGSDTTWAEKDADDILADINDALVAVWAANDMADDGLPNHILIPPQQFGSIVTRKVGVTGDKSILTYILENNIATQQGKQLVISPNKYCKQAGTDSADRMVVYINEEGRIRFHQTAPLHRANTQNVDLAFKTHYVAQVSAVEFLYPTTVYYVDGI